MRVHDVGENTDCGDCQVGVQISAVPLSGCVFGTSPQFPCLYNGDLYEKGKRDFA